MIRLAVIGLALAVGGLPFGGAAHRKTERGNEEYRAEEYDDALRSYTDAQVEAPEAPELFYDIGNVLYRQGDFDGAEELYSRALSIAPPSLAPDAAFNLGNARFHQDAFQEAIDAYRLALEARPGDQDAKRNLELALRALEQQEREENDQQQDGGEQNPEDSPQEQPEGGEDPEREPGEDPPPPSPGEQESQEPSDSDSSPPAEGRMTPEEAERLLDSLEDQERENLRKQMERAVGEQGAREEDW